MARSIGRASSCFVCWRPQPGRGVNFSRRATRRSSGRRSWSGPWFALSLSWAMYSDWSGILFSVVVVVVAALHLILDFDFIEQGALRGAPKYMEWYAAFGLMVTLIWLYLEIIRLLSKLRDRR